MADAALPRGEALRPSATPSIMPTTPSDVAHAGSEGVRAPEALSCPVCRRKPFRGRQRVCSARCRAKRHRQVREAERQVQVCEVRALLQAALTKLEDTQ